MNRTYPVSLASVLAATSLLASGNAQQVELVIAKPAQALRYTIETKTKVTTERQILIDGEEPNFGGGGGGGGFGGGPVETMTKVVFDEGREGSSIWRAYQAGEAATTREGAEREAKVESALVGKKLFLVEDDRGVVAREGSDKGEELGEGLTRGLPASMDISGLVPAKSLAVEQEYELGKSLRGALKSLVHPVRPDRGNAAGRRGGEGGEAGGRRGGRGGEAGEGRPGRGEQGGEQGGERRPARGGEQGGEGRPARGGEQGGEGRPARGGGQGGEGRAAGFARGMFGGGEDAALSLLTNDKLDLTGKGKLLSVETKDGVQLATVALNGKLTGKGKPADLGLSALGTGRGGFGGARGGRGGAGGGAGGAGVGAEEGTAEADVAFEGTLVLDVTNKRVHSLDLVGNVRSKVDSVRTMGDREIESHADTEGRFEVKVAVAPTPAEKKGD